MSLTIAPLVDLWFMSLLRVWTVPVNMHDFLSGPTAPPQAPAVALAGMPQLW